MSTFSVTPKEALKVLWDALPSLLLIIIVIGGILKGVFTATEGSAIAVVYALILSLCYRSLENKRPAVHYIEFLQDHLYCYFYDWRVIHHVMGHGLYHDSHCHCQRHAVPQQQ